MPRWLILIMLLLPAVPVQAAQEPVRAAVFDLEIIDTSGEPQRPELEARRLATSDALRRELAETANFDIVDMAPAAEAIAGFGHLRTCPDCVLDVARGLGADVAVTAFMHKVSSLILTLEIQVRDVADGRMLALGQADIRGDNDRSWLRGVEWLVRNRIAPQTERAGAN